MFAYISAYTVLAMAERTKQTFTNISGNLKLELQVLNDVNLMLFTHLYTD